MNLIEADWIKAIRTGNLKAFDALFKSYYSSLCVYATDILKSRTISEEVVQDVFLKFWNNRESIQIKTSLKSYLFRMVHNYTLNYIRDHSGKNSVISLDDLATRSKILDIQTSANILDDIVNQQIEKELKEAIENLPPQCREIFCMARYQELSYSEIATELGISVSTVKSQMLRSIDKLKVVMGQYLK